MDNKVNEENNEPATPLVERRGRKLTSKGSLLRLLDRNPEEYYIFASNWCHDQHIDIKPREKKKLGRILRANGRNHHLVGQLNDQQITDLLAHLQKE